MQISKTYIILFITILLLFLSSCTKVCPCEDLQEKNGLTYSRQTNELFTGVCESTIASVKKRIPYKEGKIHGYLKTWYLDGELLSVVSFKNGERNDWSISYYKDNQKK